MLDVTLCVGVNGLTLVFSQMSETEMAIAGITGSDLGNADYSASASIKASRGEFDLETSCPRNLGHL